MGCDIGKLLKSYFKEKSHTFKVELLCMVTKLIKIHYCLEKGTR